MALLGDTGDLPLTKKVSADQSEASILAIDQSEGLIVSIGQSEGLIGIY